MRLVRSLFDYLQRWIARYQAALDYIDTTDWRPKVSGTAK
jgi:hypothetical protein